MLKCQFDRLEWVQENPDILVNQLRENSFTDDQIEGIFTGTMPVSTATVHIDYLYSIHLLFFQP